MTTAADRTRAPRPRGGRTVEVDELEGEPFPALEAALALARPLQALASAVEGAEGCLEKNPAGARVHLAEARSAIAALRQQIRALERGERR